METCEQCGGSRVREVRVADSDKIDLPCPACTCDRTEIIMDRSVNCGWITIHNREMLKATLRIALDAEVRAGGPYLDKSSP